MARRKRPWGVVAGPIIFVVGMGVFLGARSADSLKDRFTTWAHELEHSPEPVVMVMPDIPVVPPLIINNQRMGRIEQIVVQRHRPRSIDSVRVVASLHADAARKVEDCNLRFRLQMNSHSVDLGDIRRALRCVSDTEGLVRFGTLEIARSDLEMPIFVRPADFPCDGDVAVGACADGQSGGQSLELRELKEELRDMARELRTQAHELRDEVRTSIRSSVR